MKRYALMAILAAQAAGAQTIAIVGGTVYPVSGPKIEHGTVIVRDGVITAVGANVPVPSGATTIDATGKWVTPGLINAGTQLGLIEIQAVADTRDDSPKGTNGVAAAFTVVDGLNPRSVLWQPARNDGVTSVVDLPTGGLIAGQAAFVDLAVGASAAEMTLKAPVGMVGQVGNPQQAGLTARGEVTGRLRELFIDVQAFDRNRAQYERAQERTLSASHADLEALVPVLKGQLPLVVLADRASDIQAAIALGQRYGIKIMIAGGAEAWEVAPALAAAHVPVLTGTLSNIPSGFDALGSRQDNAALLRRAGVSVLLIGNSGEEDAVPFNVRNIRQDAGTAVAYGLSWDEALRAITLAPAEVFGVADRVGSLRVGREANIVVWSGDPFEFSTRAEAVLVRGKPALAPSRQDLLVARYRKLPPVWH
ncbi:MAG TPA: amidohydrolase family protein [Gemmatimonadaceae bacterium]|nr:amidohydrolase family protein [Gemmatimonadaceae bacterium]